MTMKMNKMRRCSAFLLLAASLSPSESFPLWSISSSAIRRKQYARRNRMRTTSDNDAFVLSHATIILRRMTATNENTDTQQQAQEDEIELSNHDKNNYILQDDTTDSKINPELAERIWNWEQELRGQRQLPKVEYSIRNGLRLVDQTVQEVLQRRLSEEHEDNVQNSELYADLIQEGLAALLDAMSLYRADHYNTIEDKNGTSSDDDSSTTEADFEAYALHQIRAHLAIVLNEEDSRRPLRLPQSIRNVLKRAKRVAAELTQEAAGQKPTLQQVAERMNQQNSNSNMDKIPVNQLRDYLRHARLSSRRRTLSVESTVEIFRPHGIGEDSSPAYTDQEEWELQQGTYFLDDGHGVLHRDELIHEYLDESVELEGDDEAWIQQAQIAGPLQDLIPDNTQEPSPDDLALAEMIRHDVREFLSTTLDDEEHCVVRLVFGLDSGRQLSLQRTALAMGIEQEKVSKLLQGAMNKLRQSYTERYASDDFLDEDVVDSV